MRMHVGLGCSHAVKRSCGPPRLDGAERVDSRCCTLHSASSSSSLRTSLERIRGGTVVHSLGAAVSGTYRIPPCDASRRIELNQRTILTVVASESKSEHEESTAESAPAQGAPVVSFCRPLPTCGRAGTARNLKYRPPEGVRTVTSRRTTMSKDIGCRAGVDRPIIGGYLGMGRPPW